MKGLENVTDDEIRRALLTLQGKEKANEALMKIARESWLAGWEACDQAYREALAPFGITLKVTKGMD